MKFLKQKIAYPQDCIRISSVALQHGWYITPLESEALWNRHSESFCASWLTVPECEDELWHEIKGYLEE